MIPNYYENISHVTFENWSLVILGAPDYIFPYYLDVVSTKVRTSWIWSDTFQFSVTELSRELDHSAGSHGMPGIFFKYDFSPVCVTIKEHSIPFGRFLVRLCGIIGGIFATSCIVNGLINTFKNVFLGLISPKLQSKDSDDISKDNFAQNGIKQNSQNILLPFMNRFFSKETNNSNSCLGDILLCYIDVRSLLHRWPVIYGQPHAMSLLDNIESDISQSPPVF